MSINFYFIFFNKQCLVFDRTFIIHFSVPYIGIFQFFSAILKGFRNDHYLII